MVKSLHDPATQLWEQDHYITCLAWCKCFWFMPEMTDNNSSTRHPVKIEIGVLAIDIDAYMQLPVKPCISLHPPLLTVAWDLTLVWRCMIMWIHNMEQQRKSLNTRLEDYITLCLCCLSCMQCQVSKNNLGHLQRWINCACQPIVQQ